MQVDPDPAHPQPVQPVELRRALGPIELHGAAPSSAMASSIRPLSALNTLTPTTTTREMPQSRIIWRAASARMILGVQDRAEAMSEPG